MAELRKSHRERFRQKIELIHKGSGHPGYLDNISLSGALVRLDDDTGIDAGELCLLRIHLSEEAVPPLEIRSETVHGGSCLVGVRFVDGDVDIGLRLSLLMERTIDNLERPGDHLDRIRGYLADYHGRR